MGDREHRATVRPQLRLQPLDRPVVEVVGRLVQEQQLRPAGQDARQGEPGALTAGEGAQWAFAAQPRQAEVVQRDVHPVVGVVPVAGLVAGEELLVRGERARVAAAGVEPRAARCSSASKARRSARARSTASWTVAAGGRGTVWGRYPTPPTAPTVTSPLSGRS